MIRMIRVGDTWLRLDDVSAVQRAFEDKVAVFLRSGAQVRVRGTTVDELVQAIDDANRAARTPVAFPPAPEPERASARRRQTSGGDA